MGQPSRVPAAGPGLSTWKAHGAQAALGTAAGLSQEVVVKVGSSRGGGGETVGPAEINPKMHLVSSARRRPFWHVQGPWAGPGDRTAAAGIPGAPAGSSGPCLGLCLGLGSRPLST